MFAVSPPYNILKYVPWINNTVAEVAWLLVVTLELAYILGGQTH